MPEDFSHDYVSVHVVIESMTLTPEQITHLVGAQCDESRQIGDPRGHAGKAWERNWWKIMIRKKAIDHPGLSAHDLLSGCLEEFLDRLERTAEGLKKAVISEGGEFGIHITSTFIPALSFEPRALKLISSIGLSLDIDVVLYADDD